MWHTEFFIVNTTNQIYERERRKMVYSEYNKPDLRAGAKKIGLFLIQQTRFTSGSEGKWFILNNNKPV